MVSLISKYFGYFSIESSSDYGYMLNNQHLFFSPEDILVNNGKHWCSGNENNFSLANQSIKLSFHDLPIYAQKYTFIVGSQWNKQFPKTWNVTGIINGKEYQLDYIENSGISGNNTHFTSSFQIHGPLTELNITMIGANYLGDYYFCLQQLQLYGYPVNFLPITDCRSPINRLHLSFFVFAIFI